MHVSKSRLANGADLYIRQGLILDFCGLDGRSCLPYRPTSIDYKDKTFSIYFLPFVRTNHQIYLARFSIISCKSLSILLINFIIINYTVQKVRLYTNVTYHRAASFSDIVKDEKK